MSAFGDTLRQARAQKGLTLREAEIHLRINRHYLAALEEESFDNLPAPPYQRGIVRSYATYLGLDPTRISHLFEEARGSDPDAPALDSAYAPVDVPHHWTPNFAMIIFALISGAVMLTWLYSAYFSGATIEPSPIALQATVTPVSADVLFVPSPTPLPPTAVPTLPPTLVPTETPVPQPTQVNASQPTVPTDGTSTSTLVGNGKMLESLPSPMPAGEAGIKITGLVDIWVQIAVDGEMVYEGFVREGQSTMWVVGTEFSVYTNSASNTLFTNHQGTEFFMDDSSGEGVYKLYA